jgi:hypothetical protein
VQTLRGRLSKPTSKGGGRANPLLDAIPQDTLTFETDRASAYQSHAVEIIPWVLATVEMVSRFLTKRGLPSRLDRLLSGMEGKRRYQKTQIHWSF